MRRRLGLFFTLVLAAGLLIGPGAPGAAAAPSQLLSGVAARQNAYPIVLVHGLAGWGRDEALGLRYWGGLYDIEEHLTSRGYATYTAAVGPFSSNWDRAAELYAQLLGGRADYGAAHAAKHGHARYGKTYPGMYPEWGSLDQATGKPRKIHLIGHSQGGQTIRVLVQLLAEGSPEEIAATPANELSPLFNGARKPWVHSVTTIATPHDGSALAVAVNTLLPNLQQMIAFIAGLVGATTMNLYDFKLDQWGLRRNPGESFASYANRVWSSGLWTSTKDISAWDLAPDGAKELNSWVKAQPDVYYFSWSAEKTYESWLTGHQLPEITINPFWTPNALFIGAYTRNEPGHVRITSDWWQNDGWVNTISMNGPKVGSSDRIVSGGTPQLGAWNHLGVLSSYDHTDVIGFGLYDMRGWYLDQAMRLAALPQ